MKEKKTANLEIKKINRTGIYHLLWEKDALSRQDIVMDRQLCLPTVTQNLNELMEEKLVEERGSVGNTGGRRAMTYGINPTARTAIGMDITKQHITAVAVDLQGNIMGKIRVRAKFSRTEEYYSQLGDIVKQIIVRTKLDRDTILGVGIGVPGLITEDCQNVFYGKILDFTGATCGEFSQYIPFQAAMLNDANAAAFAETWLNKDVQNAFYLMLSDNVGGAVYVNNQVYSGDNFRSGEIGHIPIVPNGKPCYCGQRGCVDAYCAATVLTKLTDGSLGQFFSLLKSGDAAAGAVWKEYLQYLSETVNILRTLFDCRVILGGYVGEYIGEYMEELKRLAVAQNTFEENADYLVCCHYKTEAIAAGSALRFISQFLNTI